MRFWKTPYFRHKNKIGVCQDAGILKKKMTTENHQESFRHNGYISTLTLIIYLYIFQNSWNWRAKGVKILLAINSIFKILAKANFLGNNFNLLLFALKYLFMCLKVSGVKEEGQRQSNLLILTPDGLSPGTNSFILVSHMGAGDPNSWAKFHSSQAINRKLDLEWDRQYKKWYHNRQFYQLRHHTSPYFSCFQLIWIFPVF